ncbi:MAG: TCR/Tet family MFS transporter [Planctomycetales bacterium]|nr:TCR/Tet family MFS transporter [Planctomycetales bacterium]
MNIESPPNSEEMPASESGPPVRRATIIFIFVTILLDVLSLGVVIPVLPQIIEDDFLGGDTARAAVYLGLFGTVWALMQFLFSPVLGTLSDRFGRRKVILLSCFGLGLDYILMALAPNLIWMFVGRLLSGVTAASFATAGAYIADVTPPEKRAASYGLIGAAWGIGFIVGPALGGLLGDFGLTQFGIAGLRIPMWVAAGLTLLNAAYGYFILPESLAPENRSRFSWRKANPLGSLKLLRSHSELLGLASVLLIYQLAHQVFPSVFVLYAGHRYSWGPKTVGITLMVVGIASVIMQGFVVRRTAAMLGERRMLFIALTFGGLGYFIYGIANSGWMFWGAIPVFALVGFFSPAIQGLMTRRVSAREQGQLQGANSSLMGIAGMLGPVTFTWVFSAAIRESAPVNIPGAPFFLATGLHVLAIIVAVYVLRLGRAKAEGAAEGGQ